ncbi:hypothetical protein P1X14_11270 [Sphingomonas sp. AOB5]|uniref:hypothetical protein n=1 Tax=Sphingomonas sp. AOB5 TaxID=3034017 RepID=UPI0023FA1FFF|nr:hypothetical protein [Sphingomonas sp. AOB5]MDF7775828.1 hypothetical protein [Sphingomonas sp. AOB5]
MFGFWMILLCGTVIGAVFAGILIRLRVSPGHACILSPALTVFALCVVLLGQFTMFELGPFVFIPLFLAYWLAMAAAAAIAWLSLRRESEEW